MSAEVTPAVRRAAEWLLVTEHGEHADMYEPQHGQARAVVAAGLGTVEETARAMYAAWTTAEGYPERTYDRLDVYTRHMWFDTAKEFRAAIVGAA